MNALKLPLLAIMLVAMTGCTLRPELVTGHIRANGEMEIIEVTLRSSDAKAIKDREIYFSITVVDCESSQEPFPIQPYIAGILASKFDFSVTGEHVTFYGSIPKNILSDYLNPCATLNGGSYLFGKIESAPIRLARDRLG